MLEKSRVLQVTSEISERNHFMLELYAKAWCYFEKLPISKFSFLSCSLIMASGLWLASNLGPLIVGQASNRKENVSVGVPAFRK